MTSAAPSATLTGLAVATMFRGDRAQLIQWCNYHLNLGVERLYVILDRPEESVVEALPTDARLHWEVLDQQAWDAFYAPSSSNVERRQVDAIRWIARRAQAEGHDYLAFVDTDEIIELEVPFREVTARHPEAAALVMPVREMWFEAGADRIDEPFGATLGLRWLDQGLGWRRAFGWRAQYFRNGMLGHDAGKTIYRLPLASGMFSVHGPLSGRLRAERVTLPEDVGRLLHFDCGSLATWNAKWTARLLGSTVAAALGPHRRAQLRLFAHELRRDRAGQAEFFSRFFSLPEDVVEDLEKDGRIRRTDLSALTAGPLPVPPASKDVVQLPTTTERVDLQLAMVCDQNFVSPTFATMLSVLSQIDPAKSVRFVILGDGLRPEDVRRFREFERTDYRVEVQVHDVTADLDRDVGVDAHKRSRATYGRVYLVDLLPEQRTIYLDGDVLATRDISELFELDLGDACIAGVPDSAALRLVADPSNVPIDQRMRLAGIAGDDPLDYLNAGVLVHDLDHPDYRELALMARAYVSLEGRALAQHDQDAINLAFAGRKHRLPSTYNYMTQFYTSERALDGDLIGLKYAAADASLIHFSGKIKPWIASEDEFYNGLYRRLVTAAEDKVGVSCGFYFSRPRPTGHREWSIDRWRESFHNPPQAAAAISPRSSDIELVDVTDSAVYLRLTSEAYRHACAAGFRLTARVGGSTLFELPLDRFGEQQTHLAERIGHGVRRASLDLVAALASHGGVARQVELLLTVPDSGRTYERSLGVLDVLAAGSAAVPQLLTEIAVEGRVESLNNGWLIGWYRSPGAEAIHLHIGGELVAGRVAAERGDGARPARFRAAHLVGLGYGSPDSSLTVRIAGTNVPLPGLPVSVASVRAAEAPERPAPTRRARELAGRLRRKLLRPQ